jgi:hypothetical protein
MMAWVNLWRPCHLLTLREKRSMGIRFADLGKGFHSNRLECTLIALRKGVKQYVSKFVARSTTIRMMVLARKAIASREYHSETLGSVV